MSFTKMQFNHAKTSSNPLVISAILVSACKRHLTEIGQETLATHITGIKMTQNSITILTGNPLINSELKFQREWLHTAMINAGNMLHVLDLKNKRLLFR